MINHQSRQDGAEEQESEARFFLSMYPAMGIEGVQYWPGERLVGQKRTGLGETSGAEKDWPG